MQTTDELLANLPQPSPRKKCETLSRSKDELRYWKNAIRQVPNSPYWYAEIQRNGIRRKISLETSNKAAAAARARAIWQEVRVLGWEGWLAKHKPERLPDPDPSIGALLDAIQKTADLEPKTLRAYSSALRRIVNDIAKLSDCRNKYGNGKAHKAWLQRVEAQKLSLLSPTNIQSWKRDFLARAGHDPLSQRSARTSVNTYLRCARSLFSPKILVHVTLQMPDPLPFASISFEPRGNIKYRSEFDVTELIAAAREELTDKDPEVFKIFCLGCFAGLRRREIDLLEWSSFRWEENLIRIQTTEFFAAKTEDSLGEIPIDPELTQLFRGFCARSSGRFVIESQESPRPELTYAYYRCNELFERLVAWLRSHGVRSKKPLHTLRKEFGSQLCNVHGIYAASRALRHSQIAITAAFYTDSRARATIGLGHLLESQKVVEFKQEVA
jgi:integrase